MIQNQQMRIAVIPAAPAAGALIFRVKATPVTSAGVLVPGSMQPLVRTAVGRIVQANREIISAATQMAPVATCQTAVPTVEEYGCNETRCSGADLSFWVGRYSLCRGSLCRLAVSTPLMLRSL